MVEVCRRTSSRSSKSDSEHPEYAVHRLYVDEILTRYFLLGIYPRSNPYTFLLNEEFISYVKHLQNSDRLATNYIQFISTQLDNKFKIIGEGKMQFFLREDLQANREYADRAAHSQLLLVERHDPGIR